MSEQALRFKRIEIHRVPGVPRNDGFPIDGLCPTVNLIHGPNGAGKTTTARVIHELLWPGRTDLKRASAAGAFELGQQAWEIEVDAGAPIWRCDGRAAEAPALSAPEYRALYHLALDRLIQEDDATFAKQVADATQGGYDLHAAALALDYRESPRSRATYRKAVEREQSELRTAQGKQQVIDEEARRLDELQQKKKRAEQAAEELARLRTALEHAEQESERHNLQAQLDRYPVGMAQLNGQELEQARSLAKQLDDLQRQLDEQANARKEAEARRDECNLPAEGVPYRVLSELRELCKQAEQLATEIGRLEREQAKAARHEQETQQRLSAALNDVQLQALDTIEIGDLTEFARAAERVRAERRVLEERQRWLAEETSDTFDAATVQEGLTLLGRWMAAPTATTTRWPRRFWLLLGAAAIILLLAVALAAIHHGLWLLVAAIAPLLVAIGWPRSSSENDDRRAHYERDYAATGLPAPTSWTAEAVAAQINSLGQEMAALKLSEEKASRRRALADAETDLAKDERQLDEERKQLTQQFGVDLPTADEWLAALVDNVARWQRALDERRGLDSQLERAKSQLQAALQSLNERLAAYGYEPAETAEQVRAAVEDLADRQTRHERAVQDAEAAQKTIAQTLTPQIKRAKEDYAALFERFGLDTGDQNTLSTWIEQRPAYLDLSRKVQTCEALRDAAAKKLAGHETLLELSASQIEARIEETERRADEHEHLINEIVGIQKSIEHAKAGHDVGDALAQLQQAQDELADKQEEDCRAVVGHLLTEHVRQSTAEQARPPVFRRASELLARITRGRLRLELSDDGEAPAFVAYDALAEHVKPLHELSIGERVQVLLAVRLGFLEQEERSTRLPLLMDETLGNADDQRAGAIIDAIIQIARDGRQVFYFSAQADEIGKWCSQLDAEGLRYVVKDLQQIRGRTAAETTPLRIATPQLPQAPAPNGDTHAAYGQRLDVPGLDPQRQTVGQVHLWHLIDDPSVLHGLLTRGISRWGQLRNLMDQGAAGLVPDDPQWRARVVARARAVEAAFEAWRIGRSRPIDRAVLEDSEAVTETFIDRVSEVLVECEGDPDALLAALEDRQVERWQKNKTEELREYLEAQSYLDSREPASAEDVRIGVLSRVARELDEGLIDQAWIERLVAMLFEEADAPTT